MAQATVSVRTYAIIFVTLLLLTATTVAVAELPLGAWHTPLALAIAGCKALLVVLFFMHLIHSSKLTWLMLGGALFALAIMLTYLLSDYWTRGWLAS